jgi:hypothetical protein
LGIVYFVIEIDNEELEKVVKYIPTIIGEKSAKKIIPAL